MKNKKRKKLDRPWLTPTGVEIPTEELRQIVKTWGRAKWAEYLDWYETGRKDRLVATSTYEIICDTETESIFQKFLQSASQEDVEKCDQLLASLPYAEAQVLRLYYLHGMTEVQIAKQLRRSRTGVSYLKNTALRRLKWGNCGDQLSPRRFMRGVSDFSDSEESSIWDKKIEHPLKENRPYDPDNHNQEFELIRNSSVQVALFTLSELARQILYLRYWCDFSINQIARKLRMGVNVVDQIDSASVFKLRQQIMRFELGTNFGGEACI